MPREQIKITKSEQTALTLMGDCLGEELSDFNNLSIDELEAMLMKAYDAGYANATMLCVEEEVNKRIEYNAKWGLVDAHRRYKKLS